MAGTGGSYISREGRPIVLAAFGAAVIALLASRPLASLPLLILGALLVYLYRDPDREIPAAPLAVVSPVDGTVVAVARVDDPYLQRKCRRITIQMPLSGPFTTRSPIEAKLVQGWVGGSKSTDRHVAANKLHAAINTPGPTSLPNDRIALWLQTDELDDIVMTVVPRRFGFAPRCYIHVGQRIGQGQRCGFIPFGARLEVLLPESTRLLVSAGDTLIAGSDVIANVVHQAPAAVKGVQNVDAA
ncbi:MAG: phosphatidylserine decarboxylase [Gammaproteobacteria bacterium]|nr:MAG: phosphatidylserine decarboxylase [Gammaproteobacteria bacterium]TND01008.1 MAG: phosphatidylserine decarboxylase [Gammaproteobacteria bacterium]